MHEMSIAVELMREIERAIAGRDIESVEEVSLTIGIMRQVVPEMLETAFGAVAMGTPAEGARLRMEFVAVAGRCRACGSRFEPTADSFLCPRCGQADAEITEGDDIVLTSLTCEERNGASKSENQHRSQHS